VGRDRSPGRYIERKRRVRESRLGEYVCRLSVLARTAGVPTRSVGGKSQGATAGSIFRMASVTGCRDSPRRPGAQDRLGVRVARRVGTSRRGDRW